MRAPSRTPPAAVTVGRLPRVGVLAGVICFLTPVASSQAADYCIDISGGSVIVGEARYETDNATDFAYANAYWDGGSELALPKGDVIGAIESWWPDYEFLIYAHHEDFVGGDCASVTFRLKLDRSNTVGGDGCPSGYQSSTETLVMDSCSGGNADFLFAGKTFGVQYGSHFKYFRSTVEADGVEASASDVGCWELKSDANCELVSP